MAPILLDAAAEPALDVIWIAASQVGVLLQVAK
jgi:hypothetical protein